MEELFGTHFVQYREIPEEEQTNYQQQLDAYKEAKAKAAEGEEAPAEPLVLPVEPTAWTEIPVTEALPSSCKVIGLLFSA